MTPLREYGWRKVSEGKTTIGEILAVSSNDHGSKEDAGEVVSLS
jgi:hypothetical protein